MDIKLRVVAFPRSENEFKELEALVTVALATCDLSITRLDISKVFDNKRKTGQVLNKTTKLIQEILLFIEVSGITNSTASSLAGKFQNIYESWLATSSKMFCPETVPWLAITQRSAFIQSFADKHNPEECLVMIGSLVSSSLFYSHKEIRARVTFYHDVQTLKIQYDTLPNVPVHSRANYSKNMLLNYFHIRHVLVCSQGILIIYFCPPIVKNFYERQRVDSLPVEGRVLGQSNSILLHVRSFDIPAIISRLHFRCSNIPIHFVPLLILKENPPVTSEVLEKVSNTWQGFLSFSCRFLIELVLRRLFALQLKGLDTFMRTAHTLASVDCSLFEKALINLFYLIDLGYPIDLNLTTTIVFNYLKSEKNLQVFPLFMPPKTKLIRHAVITPTRILLWPPELIIENRVLRNFDSEFSLRVSLRDDDFTNLNFRVPLSPEIVTVIKSSLMEGLTIAGRKYEFLAWSNSQIRDHSIWMYAKDKKNEDAASIRNWMGNFSRIKSVPKFMARMGQCFSQTADAIGIPMDNLHIVTEADIERGYDPETTKPYCFTDGIGRISRSTVTKVCETLGINKDTCAFQIRYGGYKGMLVLDPTLKDKNIVFRESMYKFECAQERLEIIKHSAASKVALNRPMIPILNHLQVPTGVFLRIQEDTLQNLTEMLFDSEKAALYLSYHNNLRGVDFEDVLNSGIDLSSEPFFRAMLLASHQHDIDGIRRKVRLPIDPSEGRNMFGVVDETRTLKYDQVFVQYSTNIVGKRSNQEKTILKGKVLVTKNPCYLEGDIRILECVDVPALHHIVNCIVFPQLGHRPHPNEMSGSDLDGDEYTVIWKKELIFALNAAPGHFPKSESPFISGEITVQHMVDFLCLFIQNDRIGSIASTHLALSDMHGIDSEKVIKVARCCSIAVDFPKTGVGVYERFYVEEYPDFMEKKDKVTYRSKKALGVLYRVCRDFQNISADESYTYSNIQVDPDFVYEGWTTFKVEAEKSLSKYSHYLEQLLSTYGVCHESETMSGSYSNIHLRYQGSKDRFETEQLMSIFIRALWKQTRDKFMEEFQHCNEVPSESVLQKSSAWYVVTYSQANPNVISFPWIMADFLCHIKQLNLIRRGQPTRPVLNPVLTGMNLDLGTKLISLPSLNFNITQRICQCNLKVFSSKSFDTLETAARVLVHWAKENGTVFDPLNQNKRGPKTGFIEAETLIIIFLHFAKDETKDFGAVPLIIRFLKYCMSFRFLKYKRRLAILPFPVPQDGYLSKQAMLSYRQLAVTGDLSALYVGIILDANKNIEMEPIRVQKGANPFNRMNPDTLRRLLIHWSGVSDVWIRSVGKWKFLINAYGNPVCVRALERILNKGDHYLQQAVQAGVLPANKSRQGV